VNTEDVPLGEENSRENVNFSVAFMGWSPNKLISQLFPP
jgi:hypothetical protein